MLENHFQVAACQEAHLQQLCTQFSAKIDVKSYGCLIGSGFM